MRDIDRDDDIGRLRHQPDKGQQDGRSRLGGWARGCRCSMQCQCRSSGAAPQNSILLAHTNHQPSQPRSAQPKPPTGKAHTYGKLPNRTSALSSTVHSSPSATISARWNLRASASVSGSGCTRSARSKRREVRPVVER